MNSHDWHDWFRKSKTFLFAIWKIPGRVLEEILFHRPAKTGTRNLVSRLYSLETSAESIELIER